MNPRWLPFCALVACSAPAPTPSTVDVPATPNAELPPRTGDTVDDGVQSESACGPFDTKALKTVDRPLLDDRVRVRFFAGATAMGDAGSGKIEIERAGATVFVGARELFMGGGDDFDKAAEESASFSGKYTPITIDGRERVIAGVVGAPPEQEMVALAHGWFLDDNRDVIDVAVFASLRPDWDLASCRSFATRILSLVKRGERKLNWGKGDKNVTSVSYAKFDYTLAPGWIVEDSMGIHDFARITFRKRGVFPNPGIRLEIGLDSHPGDWASPGNEESQRAGTVLGLPVTWRLTRESKPALVGAWTVSQGKRNRDHAVASLFASNEADRDEAIRFAEAMRLAP